MSSFYITLTITNSDTNEQHVCILNQSELSNIENLYCKYKELVERLQESQLI
jgi:hypothetical protein